MLRNFLTLDAGANAMKHWNIRLFLQLAIYHGEQLALHAVKDSNVVNEELLKDEGAAGIPKKEKRSKSKT
jgi:hypothetical protein